MSMPASRPITALGVESSQLPISSCPRLPSAGEEGDGGGLYYKGVEPIPTPLSSPVVKPLLSLLSPCWRALAASLYYYWRESGEEIRNGHIIHWQVTKSLGVEDTGL